MASGYFPKKRLAARLLEDNFNRFGRNDVEKNQLYRGLGNMATMIETLLSKVDNLEREISNLNRGH